MSSSQFEIGNQTTNGHNIHRNLSSPIKKFYSNTNIFLTGSTGFLGMLLLEKLLMSCPNISAIYLLVRKKKGKSVETRLEQLFDDIVFSRLKEQYPNFRSKIVPIEGDCELPGLGLSKKNRTLLISEIDIIFHVAATVRFDETLRKASFINVRAVRDVTRLAQQMTNLKSFVHISTAYANCIHSHVKEEVYPPSKGYKQLLIMTETLPDDALTKITPMLLGDYPNTYAFTKQIGEDVLIQEGIGLPIGIHRPSIVQSTYQEPLQGWTNNFYGPGGYIAGCGFGILHTWQMAPHVKSNVVPADLVVNSIIATAWDVAEHFVENQQVLVYNFEAGQDSNLTWIEYLQMCLNHSPKYSSCLSVWHSFYYLAPNRMSYLIASFFFHKIPAFLADLIRFFMGKPPMFMKLYRKMDKMITVASYFITKGWSFESENVSKLKKRMSEEDRRIFFCDMKDVDWEEYLEYCIKGIRIYLAKDPLKTLPQGKKRVRRLYWMHQITTTVLLIFFLWIVWWLYSLF